MKNKLQIIHTEDYLLAVSDEEPEMLDWFYDTIDHVSSIPIYQRNTKQKSYKGCVKIIAYQPKNNAPELNLPLLPEMVFEYDVEKLPYDKLCYYDTRNPDFQIKEEYGYDKEEIDATGEFSKKDCTCDDCFYGRSVLADRIIKSATKKYSENDLRNIAKELASECLCIDGEISSPAQAFRWIEEKIQSLKTPTPKWFVVETYCEYSDDCPSKGAYDKQHLCKVVLKTETNPEGKSVLVGTYLFE
jgi:hypothetical protein